MELPRDKYVYLEDLIEIIITLCNGQTRVIIAKGDSGIYGVHLSTFYLYSEEEMDRFELEDLKSKTYFISVPIWHIIASFRLSISMSGLKSDLS